MAPSKRIVQPFSLYSTVPVPPELTSSTPHPSFNFQILFPGEPLPSFDSSDVPSLATLFQPREIAKVFGDRKLAVVIFLVGAYCQPNMYLWLLLQLVDQGVVCVIPTALVSFTNIFSPTSVPTLSGAQILEDYQAGTGTPSLKAILAELERLNETSGVLKGRLDLGRVALGGHSLGGAVTLESGNKSNLPGLRSVFTYGTTLLAGGQGRPFCPAGAVLPFYRAEGSVPTLIIGGTNEVPFVGDKNNMEKMFNEGFGGGGAEVYMANIAGASHMTVCHPNCDPTILANLRLLPATCDEDGARDLVLELVATFLQAHLTEGDSSEAAAASKERLVELTDPLRTKALAGGGYRPSTSEVTRTSANGSGLEAPAGVEQQPVVSR